MALLFCVLHSVFHIWCYTVCSVLYGSVLNVPYGSMFYIRWFYIWFIICSMLYVIFLIVLWLTVLRTIFYGSIVAVLWLLACCHHLKVGLQLRSSILVLDQPIVQPGCISPGAVHAFPWMIVTASRYTFSYVIWDMPQKKNQFNNAWLFRGGSFIMRK